MTIALPIYPDVPGLTYNQKWSPKFFNMPTSTTATGADIDLALSQWPLHDFELTYSFLRDFVVDENGWGGTEFQTLMGFFLMSGGSTGRFLYRNTSDYKVSQQSVGTGDGATTTFLLQRTFGTATYNATEPVGAVNTNETFNVWRNGNVIISPSSYTLNTSVALGQTITFATAPNSGALISCDMSYYYCVKFPADTNTFEKFMNKLWLLNKVVLHSCRVGA